jgi:hypothetical protein
LDTYTEFEDRKMPTFNENVVINGKLGIGVEDPQVNLEMSGAYPGLWLKAGSGGDGGRFWVEYPTADSGHSIAPNLVLSDFDDPPRIRFQQTGGEAVVNDQYSESHPQFESWMGHAKGKSSDIAIMGGNVGIGTVTPRVSLDVPQGALINGIAIGVEPPGPVEFPYGYETIGTWGERTNLRLHSNQRIYFHPGNHQNSLAYLDPNGDLSVGGDGQDGDIYVRDSQGNITIRLDGNTGFASLGGNDKNCGVIVKNRFGRETVRIDGDSGDIVLQNADCAEEFEVATSTAIVPGTVMVFDETGRLTQSAIAYDKRVVGVVSGAGSLKPGIVLGKQPDQANRSPIALVGRVYCQVDADAVAIEVGDLLVTSSTPGHAMKATDPLQAFGAVIGKAMAPLEAGQGLIPIVVALQ